MKTKIIGTEMFVIAIPREQKCSHRGVYIEPACCSGRDCPCGGQDRLYCPKATCPGIKPSEVRGLMQRLSKEEL